MLHVVAIVTARPGQRSALLAAFKTLLPLVHSEAGCIEYNATIDAADASPAFGPDVFVVIEKWENKASLEAHSVSSHMKRHAEKTSHIVASVIVHQLSEA
jgi:quinol monooxygenase YgiN